MPVPWIPEPWIELLEREVRPGHIQEQRRQQQIDEDLVVTAESSTYDPLTKVFLFSRGVVATYGVTTIRAERLEIHMAEGEQWAKATGSVRIEDPEATITAEDLEFTWKPENRSGKASNVRFQVGHTHVRARQADLKPTRWEFTGVEVTNCPEIYWVRSPRLTVEPGRSGKIEAPTFYAFDRRIVRLPDRRFNLDPRTQGIGLPSINYRKGQGLGVGMDAGILLNETTNLFVSGSAYPRQYPAMAAVVTKSDVPVERASAVLTPPSELGERFGNGYLDNIEVGTPDLERRVLGTERRSISLGSIWNAGVSARRSETAISKAIEVVVDRGGRLGGRWEDRENAAGEVERVLTGGLSYYGQLRGQTIRERGGPFVTRAVFNGTALLPPRELAPNLSTILRVDTSQYVGSGSYGWVRGLAGLVYEPNASIRLSGGLVGSFEMGSPQFSFDRLYAEQGMHFRADFNLGPTRLSVLHKYDTRLKWYDREYMISQVAGCFEPFVIYRQFPQDYRFGLRLRIDDLSNILSRRQFRRSKGAAPAAGGHRP